MLDKLDIGKIKLALVIDRDRTRFVAYSIDWQPTRDPQVANAVFEVNGRDITVRRTIDGNDFAYAVCETGASGDDRWITIKLKETA